MKTHSDSDFLRFAQKCLPVLLAALCLLPPQFAQAKPPPPPPTPDYNCVVAGHPWAPVYQDLKGIGLLVEVLPNRYMEAVACHGRENQCADNAGVVSDKPDQRPVFIKQWTDDYNAYPPSLHYDNLVRAFTEGINATIQPFVMPENCKRPQITVQSINDIWLPPGKPANKDMLTIVVRLQIFDSMKPRIAVLRTDLYRPDELHSDFKSQTLLGRVMPISLDWSDDVIAAKVSDFAKGLGIIRLTYQATSPRKAGIANVAVPEIEIDFTPEMLEAGAGEVYFDDRFEGPEEAAKRVFVEMLRAAPTEVLKVLAKLHRGAVILRSIAR